MEEEKVVEILRYHQHDLLNELQIIQGYSSMGKLEIVQAKIDKCIKKYQEERKLMNLNSPKFILWVIQLNHLQENIDLSYHIQTDNMDLSAIDHQLYISATYIIQEINELGNDTELYQLLIEINHIQDLSELTIQFEISGKFTDNELIERRLNDFFTNNITQTKIQKQEGKIRLRLSFSL